MTIAICTPTGNIGRHVVRELLEAGESIRLIARNPDKLDVETRQRTEVVQGSIEDTSLLTRNLS